MYIKIKTASSTLHLFTVQQGENYYYSMGHNIESLVKA